MIARAGAALLAALCVAPAALAQEKPKAPKPAPKPAKKPGFLGVGSEPWTIPDSKPPRAYIRIARIVPGSSAAKAGLDVGDILMQLDGESLAADPKQVVAEFGKRIRAKGAGSTLRIRVRRRTISVRSFLNEKPQGEWKDGPAVAAKRLFPDLAALLEKHPETLVGVRARSFTREREVKLVLGLRPGTRDEPLPKNETLRPELHAEKLLPSAALAQAAIGVARVNTKSVTEVFAELRRRLDADEKIDDPFRLKTVRYLHRAPLKLANATRGLGKRLRAVLTPSKGVGPDTRALMTIVRAHLDAPAPKLPKTPVKARPPKGSSPGAHGRYVFDLIKLARDRIKRATAGLSPKERAFLVKTLPSLAAQFANDIYLHVDPDQDRWRRHARAIKLLPKIDRALLLSALDALLPVAHPAYLAQLGADLRAAEQEMVKQGRRYGAAGVQGPVLWAQGTDIVIGRSADNAYTKRFTVVIDPGGDDRYHAGVGGGRPDDPASLCIDLAGNDRYQATDEVSHGAGFFGVGLLIDRAGDDIYTSNQSFAQGAALAGVGVLIDVSGDDVYRGLRYAQGSALCHGLGALLDGGGNDQLTGGVYAQGFGGPGGFGCLLASGGNDRYAALGLYQSGYRFNGMYRGMSQGASIGFRHQASGGIGVLLDEGGKDTYEAGNFSQGCGYFFGWGVLIDLGVDPDRYEGSRYAQGSAAHSALGSCWDEGGDDIYRGWVGAGNSAAWDLAVTVFLDDGGNDRYDPGPGFSIGASAHNGFSLFVDRDGRDSYRVAPGQAGPNNYHGGPSVSVFVDAGGQKDTYRGGGLADNRAGITGNAGILLDLPKAIGEVDRALLERLLNKSSK